MTRFRTPRPFVLTLSGYARTGKDTVVQALRGVVPGVRRVAFADPVREFARDFYGVGDGTEEWWTGERKAQDLTHLMTGDAVTEHVRRALGLGERVTGRDLLIFIGMEMRKRQPDYWLDAGVAAVKKALAEGASAVVVTDARFPNEVERFASLDGVIGPVARWHLTRPGTTPQGSADRAVDEIDETLFTSRLVNDGTIEQLQDKVVLHLEAAGLIEADPDDSCPACLLRED